MEVEVIIVRANLLHGKEQDGIDLWHQQEQESQKNLLIIQFTLKDLVALTTLDGWMAITLNNQVNWLKEKRVLQSIKEDI